SRLALACLSLRQQAKIVHRNSGAGDGGYIGMIVSRRNLDDIRPDYFDLAELPQRGEHASGRRASGYGRARSRRIGRVQAVYVECNIGLDAASSLDDRIGEVGCAHLVYLVSGVVLDKTCILHMYTHNQLYRSVRIDAELYESMSHKE